MRAAKVQASLRIRAVSPEPSLLAHTSSESRGTFRQKARSPAPLNGWACAVKICHDGMLEDTNSLDGAQLTTALLESAGESGHRCCFMTNLHERMLPDMRIESASDRATAPCNMWLTWLLNHTSLSTLSVPYLYENTIPSAKIIFGKTEILGEKCAKNSL